MQLCSGVGANIPSIRIVSVHSPYIASLQDAQQISFLDRDEYVVHSIINQIESLE